MFLTSLPNQFKAPALILLVLIFLPFSVLSSEKWRGPAHLVISTGGTFVLSEIPTRLTDNYKTHNLYIFSSTIMLIAGFGKEAADEAVQGKKFSWEDIGLDLIGITTGVLSHYFLSERKKKHKIQSAFNINKKEINFTASLNF